MADLARLIPIFKLVEEKAAIRSGKAIQRRDNLIGQLEQIKQYRSEYENVDNNVVPLLINARSFLQRLDKSIKEAEVRLEQQSKTVELEVSQWQKAQARRKAIEKIVNKTQSITRPNNTEHISNWQARCTFNDDS